MDVPTTRVLLKARPVLAQLADRLAPPVPEGLELYLDRHDLLIDDWLKRIQGDTAAAGAPPNFTWIVEAPIRTLGGALFDLTVDDADHRATIQRVVEVGAAIGAIAANIHVVAPTLDADTLTDGRRLQKLDEARPLLEYYADACQKRGLVPQIENVPPVGRMREAAFVYSPIGLACDDLLFLTDARSDVRVTLDVSHAALFLNWRKAPDPQVGDHVRPVARFCRARSGPDDLASYTQTLAGVAATVHVSNASGLLGEGLPYGAGEEDLDHVLSPLLGTARFFVTETIEEDPERANKMRDAQRRLLALRTARGASR